MLRQCVLCVHILCVGDATGYIVAVSCAADIPKERARKRKREKKKTRRVTNTTTNNRTYLVPLYSFVYMCSFSLPACFCLYAFYSQKEQWNIRIFPTKVKINIWSKFFYCLFVFSILPPSSPSPTSIRWLSQVLYISLHAYTLSHQHHDSGYGWLFSLSYIHSRKFLFTQICIRMHLYPFTFDAKISSDCWSIHPPPLSTHITK